MRVDRRRPKLRDRESVIAIQRLWNDRAWTRTRLRASNLGNNDYVAATRKNGKKKGREDAFYLVSLMAVRGSITPAKSRK